MAESFTPLCDVDPMSDKVKVKARCVSIWRSHAPGKPTPVWSLDCVIQDEQVKHLDTITLFEYYYCILNLSTEMLFTIF